ncbi:hydroxymethylglutaryl-CoA reductase, degradative [Candidatus Micrarchaeota archaeon]|nr:hydroxymethylglutaryl-CoA reductase, degradative [Candidatus Micrarchaeota archaeon]
MTNLSGFYKLNAEERLNLIKKKYSLSKEEVEILKNTGALSISTADRMIENVVSTFHLPFALANNFVINGKEYLIPMVLEEPSVVAAACKAAKLSLPAGFTSDADEPVMIGQIQIMGIKDTENAKKMFEEKKAEILQIAKTYAVQIEKFGGGIKALNARVLESIRGKIFLVEFDVDVRDAMGANTINTILEGVAPSIIQFIGGTIRLRILSNLAVKRKVRAKVIWKKELIGEDGVEGVLDGYALAASDIFRCSTHNKGIMNGIDAVGIATGNDWRAVEAGAHSYASLNGYKPLTHYEKNKEGDLVGSIELPLPVGTIGGAINTNPLSKIALKILGVKSARELAMAMACVGLANNFAALLALSTTGIQKGHMKLHAKNIAVLAGASTPEEIDSVTEVLGENKNFSLDFAKQTLEKVRGSK